MAALRERHQMLLVQPTVTAMAVFHWTYSVELPYDGSTLVVNFDDWMYFATQSP